METTVVNLEYDEYDVYIGRGSDWGNPYPVWEFKDREDCLKAYKWYLLNTRPDLLDRLDELRGKKLGCFCKPQLCHGDFLAELANDLPRYGLGISNEVAESGLGPPAIF